MTDRTAVEPVLIGREVELARVSGFLTHGGPARGLAIVGEPGIGKTTLWEAGLADARAAGQAVLVARASEPELQLSFVALADLLDEVEGSALDLVPGPQRRALDVAILRAEPESSPPEAVAVAAGFTRVVRNLAEQRPVIIAVDDVPWLDRASEDVLAFAARRLRSRSVRFLFTRRPGEPTPLESAFNPVGCEQLEIGALSVGAVRALLAERLQLEPPRRVLLRLFELSHGSPLVALELGRMLVDRGLPDLGEELPLPDLVDEVFGRRVAALDEPVRRAVLAVALSSGLTRLEVSSLVGPLALEDAVTSGLLVPDGSRLRMSHPLLAAAAKRLSTAEERRDVHLQLAQTIVEETLQARHLAMAASRPDDALADRIVAAAEKAIGRGAVHDAVELAEHALRLTSVGSTRHEERLLLLIRYLQIAGEESRVRELLEERLAALPPGPTRGRALLMLSETGDRLSEMETYIDAALGESGDDVEVRATALAMKALMYAIVRFERLDEAEQWAREAFRLAEGASLGTRQRALHTLAWINVMRGRPLDAALTATPYGASLYEAAIERPAGIRLMVRGNVDESRTVFERLRALAGERGEAVSASIMHRQLCEIELRAGDVRAAQRHLDEWGEWTLPSDTHEQVVGPARCRAVLAAVRGRPDEAADWAEKAIAAASAIENFREETEARRAAGVAALFAHDYTRAVEHLRPLWQHAAREGLDDPGVLPVGADLAEALLGLGDVEAAREVTDRLRRLAEEQSHPWGQASVRRCEALLHMAANAESDAVDAELAQTAVDFAALGLRHEAARSLLILGRAQRRRRKWAAARATLEHAAGAFDDLGADGWAAQARLELERIGGRRPSADGALTRTESRVAQLAAAGQSNKEIAATLVVSVYTVERHLKHVYAKLGVRSRSQLAGRIGDPGR
jgi:DNA-binding CsgD family transcriptional regulator